MQKSTLLVVICVDLMGEDKKDFAEGVYDWTGRVEKP